jgi:sn-glycerol 3-phosphate transport system ATP-binding protein
MNLLRNAPDAKPGVITGVRPEHLDITESGWALQVEAVEMLGAERLIYGRWAHSQSDEMVIVRTEESHFVPLLGSTVHVRPRPDRMHHFDAATGKKI